VISPIYPSKGATAPWSQYLHEARGRLLYVVFSLCLTFLLSYMFSVELVFLFVKPFLTLDRDFIFTELTEGLYITVKVCSFATLCAVSPLAVYQAWCFALPSLYRAERKRWNLLWGFSLLLFVLSLILAYLILLPKIVTLLLQFEIKRQALTVQLEARIGSYVEWSFRLFLVVGALCQLPLIALILANLGLLTPQMAGRNRRGFLVASILLAALISPPDLVAQWVLAIGLFLWLEMAILVGVVEARCSAQPATHRRT